VTATAYAGRAWTSPTVPLALLTLFGVVAVLAPSAVVAGRLLAGTGRWQAGACRLLPDAGRQRTGVVK
jgi:hypothetical protein